MRRNPLPNPLANPLEGPAEFMMGVAGAVFGYVVAGAADRWAATHALQGTTGSLMDQPAAGQIYNSESVDLPIWSSMTRVGVAAAAVVVPLIMSELVQGGARAFLQIAGFSALARTAGKAAEDLIAQSMATQQIVQQLYAPEIAAANRLATSTGQTLAAAAPNTFAGHPQRRQIAAPVGRAAPALPQRQAPQRQPAYPPQPFRQAQPQPQPRYVGDSSGGITAPPYNAYTACADCNDFPVPNAVAGSSILPQPPTCDPNANDPNSPYSVRLGPNGPQPPPNCQPPITTTMTPPVPTTTQVPTTTTTTAPTQPWGGGGGGNSGPQPSGGGSGGGSNAPSTSGPSTAPTYPSNYMQNNGVPTQFGPQGQYGPGVTGPTAPAPYIPR